MEPKEILTEAAAMQEELQAIRHDLHRRNAAKPVFQPAEEFFQSSPDMLANGLLDSPKVDAVGERIKTRMWKICVGLAAAMRCKATVEF